MTAKQIPQHISQQFQHELEDIRSRVLEMGGLVEQQLTEALEALAKHDLGLAETVATSDHKVDILEVRLDGECTEIIARRQPAASDLRLILAVIRIITDLERAGDGSACAGNAQRGFKCLCPHGFKRGLADRPAGTPNRSRIRCHHAPAYHVYDGGPAQYHPISRCRMDRTGLG